ncbi:MAG: hypothetical protein IJP48_09650 [Synergistaceae bacterium]|nr:hypothetical protein [Synergistaceae bacterium]
MNKKILALVMLGVMILSLTGNSSENESDKTLSKIKAELRAQYGENKKITDGNYDKSLAVKCINGTFVGKKNDGVIA